jgi:RimJ/RimL family protein N-acetyltransferase
MDAQALDPASPAPTLATARLRLIPATPRLTRLAIEAPDALARALEARLPASWPHEYLDQPALEFLHERLLAPGQAEWWMYFMVLADGAAPRTLIGSAGYKGPPTADGTLEIGYGVVRDHQRRGYASEAARRLVERAFDEPVVRRVIAETLPELVASIGVLHKGGFRLIGDGSEPGVIRFELTRAEFEAAGRHSSP